MTTAVTVQHTVCLKDRNTLGFTVYAEHFVIVANEAELVEALKLADTNGWKVFLLGGGSNLVLTQNISGLVIHITASSTQYERLSNGNTLVSVGAGKPWHELVLETLDNGLTGLENLSLIPGSTGAAPVQNIGAYGVELENRLHSVRAFHRPSETWQTLKPDECAFGYRDSIFKRHPGHYFITKVMFELNGETPPVTHYGALQQALLEAMAESSTQTPLTPIQQAKLVSQNVINIRQSKLPDPAVLGNAGSFFKNPVVSAEHASRIRQQYPNLVSYPQPDGLEKLAAGWLIDQSGLRGEVAGPVGVHKDQALVLVHFGAGTGQDLMALAERVITQIQANFDVTLEIEPIVV